MSKEEVLKGMRLTYKRDGQWGHYECEVLDVLQHRIKVKLLNWMGRELDRIEIINVSPDRLNKIING